MCNSGSWEFELQLQEHGIVRVESSCDLHVRELVIKFESSINGKLNLRKP